MCNCYSYYSFLTIEYCPVVFAVQQGQISKANSMSSFHTSVYHTCWAGGLPHSNTASKFSSDLASVQCAPPSANSSSCQSPVQMRASFNFCGLMVWTVVAWLFLTLPRSSPATWYLFNLLIRPLFHLVFHPLSIPVHPSNPGVRSCGPGRLGLQLARLAVRYSRTPLSPHVSLRAAGPAARLPCGLLLVHLSATRHLSPTE